MSGSNHSSWPIVLRRLFSAPPDARAYAGEGEAYRILRSNLEVALTDLERPTVIITSANPAEGKTATTVHLAHALTLAGRRVVVLDFDLRHPDVHHWLGVDNGSGVTDVLLDRQSLEACLQSVEVNVGGSQAPRPMYVLPAGPTVDNPAELLGAGRTARLLEALSRQADIVLVDTPPVLYVADTLVIGRMAAGAILVVESRRTAIPAIQHAKDALIRNQTRLLGIVINKFQARDADSSYGYGAAYGPYGGYGPTGNGDRA